MQKSVPVYLHKQGMSQPTNDIFHGIFIKQINQYTMQRYMIYFKLIIVYLALNSRVTERSFDQ